jgi:hypothetical protein
MNGFESIELRWFYRGILPDEIANWFDPLGETRLALDSRSDFYLQSSSLDVGVKIRQGNLELKHRQQQFGKIELDGFGESQVEQWSKWICVDRSAHSLAAEKQGWIRVDKVRQQRLYRVTFVDPIQLTPSDIPRENAVAIEITDLQLRGQSWWTIACEYLGHNISIDRQFLPLVQLLLIDFPFSIATPSMSCGYPQWLCARTDNLSSSTD